MTTSWQGALPTMPGAMARDERVSNSCAMRSSSQPSVIASRRREDSSAVATRQPG